MGHAATHGMVGWATRPIRAWPQSLQRRAMLPAGAPGSPFFWANLGSVRYDLPDPG